MTTLFRREALEARQESWLGHVQINQPLPVKIIAWSGISLICFSALFLIFGSYTKRVHATGQVVPKSGIVTIRANQTGIMSRIDAVEGLHVHKGSSLFVEDMDATSDKGLIQQQILKGLIYQKTLLTNQRILREKFAPLQHQDLLNKIHFLAQEKERINQQIHYDETIIPHVYHYLENMKQALSEKIVTESQFQNQFSLYIQLANEHEQAIRSRIETDGKISDLTAQLSQFTLSLKRDLNDMDEKISILEQHIYENEGRRTNIIVSPTDGILTGVRAYLGEQATIGTPLVTLIHNGEEFQIEVYVNSASIGFLKTGEKVLLKYDAFPYQKFGLQQGSVVEITHAPTLSNSIKDNQASNKINDVSQDIYRLRIKPEKNYVTAYGIKHLLEAGMTVSADIAIDRRSLWQWILDPLFSMKNTFETVSNFHQ